MPIIKGHGGDVKFLLTSFITISLLLVFQNCGETPGEASFFDESNSTLLNEDCLTTSCSSPEDHLWLRIRDYDPLKISLASYNAMNKIFNIGGECGTSTFKEHSFRYTLVEAFGSQTEVGSKELVNLCKNGRFSLTIKPYLELKTDERYQLRVEILGIDSKTYERVSNPMPSSIGNLDVVITKNAE